ncbi:IS3 family transposase [Fimbriiglobus ruber]|uniref:IS3 family transposase n=1 Tax=Fimbriiglobus ruber TaxID=1908690 RepID=UPI000B4B446B
MTRGRRPSRACGRSNALTPVVVSILPTHKGRYGARRIAKELGDREIACGPRGVAKVPRNQRLRAIPPRSLVPRTAHGRHTLGYNPHRPSDREDPTRVNEWWVGDGTDLPLRGGGFGYLAGSRGRYPRAIVGGRSRHP